MSSLKALKQKIGSIKSTQKIIKTMKLVSAAKMRRTKTLADHYNNFYQRFNTIMGNLVTGCSVDPLEHELLFGRPDKPKKARLLIILSADRGLCGAFNHQLVKLTRKRIALLQAEQQNFKLFTIGNKVAEILRHQYPKEWFFDSVRDINHKFNDPVFIDQLVDRIIENFEKGEIDECEIIYAHLESIMVQKAMAVSLIPFVPTTPSSVTYELNDQEILSNIARENIKTQVKQALLQNVVSEHAARMNAMENATKNSDDMLKKLNLEYNRKRQAQITKELIEIISGAEAV